MPYLYGQILLIPLDLTLSNLDAVFKKAQQCPSFDVLPIFFSMSSEQGRKLFEIKDC
jgi:hypothetical protein